MNLKAQLLVRILLIALVCLMGSAWYVLYQTDKQAIFEAKQTANRIERQTRQQMLQMFQRYDFSRPFPDVNQWRGIGGVPGSCTQFLSRTQSRERSLCNDMPDLKTTYPNWFGNVYQQFFNPDYEVRTPVNFNALRYGTVLVTLNVQMETTRAWNNLRAVIGVLTVTFVALCILMFWTINRMLQPAQRIVGGLEKMREGNLDYRLPSFDIVEWRRTSEAINALASSQQHTLAENKRLAMKLMNAQEEEHRYISRELHDEFGQCLAGINAVTASVVQTARKDCPAVVDEVQSISHITGHMMTALRNLLTRLRPSEVDELGLSASLRQLVKSWNQRSGNQTQYELDIDDSLDQLPDPLPVNIYRIVQECLTNIAKHARAGKAEISLRRMTDDTVSLIIRDDGIAQAESFENTLGMGLFGIHERVTALGGRLKLEALRYGGLQVSASLPIPEATQESSQHE
ncbi:sensor histidine kinase [Methylophaga sp. OBS1]|uniref:sensor histidine kinase n=1 Tax=Methylophaga sp. OBS1 TaxID=2991933 RepID=UPI002254EA5C|nr:histidine kinase [Methylophaga sp. OBS1]MCX4190916.1 histidine kinase [Methylophaga sp. OBS1]MCX4192138.1 histidine kinase [Methylophaga sp. OBS1]